MARPRPTSAALSSCDPVRSTREKNGSPPASGDSIARSTLQTRLKQLGIDPNEFKRKALFSVDDPKDFLRLNPTLIGWSGDESTLELISKNINNGELGDAARTYFSLPAERAACLPSPEDDIAVP